MTADSWSCSQAKKIEHTGGKWLKASIKHLWHMDILVHSRNFHNEKICQISAIRKVKKNYQNIWQFKLTDEALKETEIMTMQWKKLKVIKYKGKYTRAWNKYL